MRVRPTVKWDEESPQVDPGRRFQATKFCRLKSIYISDLQLLLITVFHDILCLLLSCLDADAPSRNRFQCVLKSFSCPRTEVGTREQRCKDLVPQKVSLDSWRYGVRSFNRMQIFRSNWTNLSRVHYLVDDCQGTFLSSQRSRPYGRNTQGRFYACSRKGCPSSVKSSATVYALVAR
jgi:hypothetical protein